MKKGVKTSVSKAVPGGGPVRFLREAARTPAAYYKV